METAAVHLASKDLGELFGDARVWFLAAPVILAVLALLLRLFAGTGSKQRPNPPRRPAAPAPPAPEYVGFTEPGPNLRESISAYRAERRSAAAEHERSWQYQTIYVTKKWRQSLDDAIDETARIYADIGMRILSVDRAEDDRSATVTFTRGT